MLAFFCYTQKAAPYPKLQGGIKINPFWKKGNAISFVRSFDYMGKFHFVKPFLSMLTIILPVS